MCYRPWTKVYSLFQQDSFPICSMLTLIALVHVLFQYSEGEHATGPHSSATSHHHHHQPTDYQTTIFPAPVGHCQIFDLYGFVFSTDFR